MKLKSSMEKIAYEITTWVSKQKVKKDIPFSDSAPLHAQEFPVKRPISYKTDEVLASFPVKVTELFLMKTSYLLISINLSHNSNWNLTDLSTKSLHWLRFYAEPFRRDSSRKAVSMWYFLPAMLLFENSLCFITAPEKRMLDTKRFL